MIRAFQWDLARQAERLDWLLEQLPRYAEWGYQELYLHLEDSVEYPSLPGVAREGAYTHKELTRLVRAADRAGIKVVPIVNLLGHTQYLIKVPALRDLNELRLPDGSPREHGQVCPVHPRTLQVAEKLLRDVAPFCTAGKVHVGLDESFHLGKHPLSRADIARHGLPVHFANYVRRLHQLTGALGLRMGMWADMLYFLPGAIPRLPRGIIAYDWYYYPFRKTPRVELFNFAERDLAAPLRARGIEYWGCPMNGAFRHEPLPVFSDRIANIKSWWNRCRAVDAGGFLVTSWEPNRLAQQLTTVVDAAAASLWLEPRVRAPGAMLARGFARVFKPGAQSRKAARIALAADRHPFAGYASWEINDRWDVAAVRSAAFSAADHNLTKLVQSARGLPEPLVMSLLFRTYLARRDYFVRLGACMVCQLRRLLDKGRRKEIPLLLAHLGTDADHLTRGLTVAVAAARAMHGYTRDPATRGQNEQLLAQDAQRLQAWRRWLSEAVRNPDHVWSPSPIVGTWQLTFNVQNFAPALQQVVVQQRNGDGTWTDLHRRFTIEFQSAAARPRTHINREFSVPVSDRSASLRIAIRGLGQVRIGGVRLTNGVTSSSPRNWQRGKPKLLGQPAPSRGFPRIDWLKNIAEIPLVFAQSDHK